MSHGSPNSRISLLKDRASLLAQVRAFFASRNVTEVDCPLLSASAAVDAHIDLIPSTYQGKEIRYLHSSPEYGMKRLLAEGMGDIYQLSHVFRDGEWGPKHNPEFLMAEWYRVNWTFEELIDETIDFIRLFLGPLSFQKLSYRDAFRNYAGIDYLPATCEELEQFLREKNVAIYPDIREEGKDALLNLILGMLIEPHLGEDQLCVLMHYPSSQAALSLTFLKNNEEMVAERFEVYYRGVELANGYHELTNSQEQRQRFEEANQMRVKMGKTALPIDELFLQALERGMPDCCGVAVGFDRLMMLRHHKTSLEEILPFPWSLA